MKYCLDASALLDLGERHYPEHVTVFAPIWQHMYTGISNGDIVSVDYVKVELEAKADEWRTNFLLQADSMFHISEGVEKEFSVVVKEIESRSEFNVNKARDRFMKGADPWLIALARNIKNCVVVSGERKNLAAYGLGAVCNTLGLKHMNLVEFFEANNIGK
jgi:Domain of unknown function (DUF4411)